MKGEVFKTLPPGVYIEKEEIGKASLELAPTGIAGFLGLAVKGPTDRAVAIRSIEEFYEVYGDPQGRGFLAPAIEGFFQNGGELCYVVRVTNKNREPSTAASLVLFDEKGSPTLKVMAKNEGEWGNQIQVEVKRPESVTRTILTLDAPEGATAAIVGSTYNFNRGTLIRIYDPDGEVYRYVKNVEGKELQWDRPLPRTFRMDGPTYVEPVVFDLLIKYKDIKEEYHNLSLYSVSPDYVVRVVNKESSLINIVDLGSVSEVPENLPKAIEPTNLQGGREDWSLIGPEDFLGLTVADESKRGLEALNVVDEIELILAPDIMYLYQEHKDQLGLPFSSVNDIKVVQEELVTYCENKRDRFAILDSPYPDDVRKTLDWRKEFDSDHAALYFPWLKVFYRGREIVLPPSGHMAGVYAAGDKEMGVHKSPANVPLQFVEDLTVELWEEEIGLLNSQNVNPLKTVSGTGIVAWGARTLSSNISYRYINVRRVISAVIRSLDMYMQWIVFEPNTPALWKMITRQVGYFLTTLWKKGYLSGSTPEEAFFVKCDEETNPPYMRDEGMLVVEVGLAPVRPAEYIVFKMAQEMQVGEGGE